MLILTVHVAPSCICCFLTLGAMQLISCVTDMFYSFFFFIIQLSHAAETKTEKKCMNLMEYLYPFLSCTVCHEICHIILQMISNT